MEAYKTRNNRKNLKKGGLVKNEGSNIREWV